MENIPKDFKNFEETKVQEFSFCWNDSYVHIVYGKFNNHQWFVAIPNEHISCITSHPTHICANEQCLNNIVNRSMAQAISLAIMMHYEESEENG